MTADDRTINQQAHFYPQLPHDPATLPMVEVGGARVSVYKGDGELRISADLDDAERVFGDPVPLKVTVQGCVVWQSAGALPQFDAGELQALITTAAEMYAEYGDSNDILSRRQKDLAERAHLAVSGFHHQMQDGCDR